MAVLALKVRASFGAAVGRVPLIRTLAIGFAVAFACAALAVGGIWLGLRLSTAGTYPSALGSASFRVELSSQGRVEVFIPLADWGLRAHAFSAPVTLHVEPRVLNRQALIAAASGNQALLRRTLKDLGHDGTRALERALRYMLAGVLLAAALGWGILRMYRSRRRWLLIGLPVGVLLVGVLLSGGLLLRVRSTWSPDALTHPTYFARGAELIQLLNAAQRASQAKDSYVSKVQGALSGFASLLSDPTAGQVASGRRALLVSDLHDNTLVLGSLSFYAQSQPVFFVGDFGNTGDGAEIRALAPRVAKLGTGVVAVSGNHDSHALMLTLARRGVTVLSSRGRLLADGRYATQPVLVSGLRVAGFDDPLEYSRSRPDAPNRIFSFAQLPDPGASTAFAEYRVAHWFAALKPRPDVVLIHQNALAQYLARSLWARGYSWPLTILTGHDHIQHVNHDGPINVVDAGTVGAGGLYGVGSNYVGLGQLHFAFGRPELEAADLIQVEPVSGVAQAQRIVLPEQCAIVHIGCASAIDYMDPREGPNTGAIEGLHPVSPLDPARPPTLSKR
jgi:Calcineurin-like phosphoesterase superfamily domain